MKRLSALEFPRTIQPELLEEGDLITITLPESRGVTMSKRGRIYRRVDHGELRQWLTMEGTVLLTWQPNQKPKYSIVLHERIERKYDEPLFDLERLA